MWFLQVLLAAAIMWWMYFLSRAIIRALAQHSTGADYDLTSWYPVFSMKNIRDAYAHAASASRRASELEQDLTADAAFKEAAAAHTISDALSRRMLTVSEAIVQAEQWWYRHSAMMDANIAALNGKSTRDEALTTALMRIDKTSGSYGADEIKLRDEWKSRLEDPSAPVRDPSPRPYSNPWADKARRRGI